MVALKWAVYADLDRLKACNETLLFDVNIFNNLPDGVARTSIRVCTADFDRPSPLTGRDDDASTESRPSNEQLVTSAIRLALSGKKAEAHLTDDVLAAGRQIVNYVNNKPTVNGNQPTLAFSSVRDNIMMGLYTGHRARQQGIHETLLEKVLAEVQQNGASDSILMELCDNDPKRGANYIVGVAASTVGNFSFVQEAAVTWADGKCMTDNTAMTVLPKAYSGVTWNALSYTHIHFAFPNVTEDFKIDVSNIQTEFDRFKKLTGVKKVVSLGGWAFSNDAATVHILRSAVLLQNQAAFQRNIVDFLEEHELDGIDIDWEYPEAMDIDGTPPGNELEGDLLAVFIKRLRESMLKGKSISFAAPSSYWYLRAYPIEIMAPFVDYVVYMTYDLHGQWDHGNAFTSPGCPSGNCLRSHINMTETITALSMMTKAGMPSNKIAVGITSYGRSFHMAEQDCYSEWCLFTGTRVKSEATPGICTGEPGYIANAEIEEMREHYLTHIKSDLLADIIVYNDTEYVSYMADEHKAGRKALYDMWHMAGTSDWAIDLQSYSYDDYYNEDYVLKPLTKCDGTYDNINDVHNDKGNIPNHCISKYVIGALGKMLEKAVGEYGKIMDDGYDKKFEYFADALRQQWSAGMSNLFSKHLGEHFDCFRKQGGGLVDHACPPFEKSPGLSAKIVLKVKDEDKLKKFILEEYAIDWDNIEFVQIPQEDNGSGHGCNFGPCGLYFIDGVPHLKRDADVPNPKSSVAESISNLRKLPDVLRDTAKDINDLPADSSPEDVIDGAMLPVFMVMTATEAMNKNADIGEELEETERKWIIGMIVTAILFVIPAIGSALTAVTGIVMIARVATLAAEAGSAVCGAIDIAESPENAVAGIFGIVLGIAGVGSAVKGVWKEAASLRRGFKAADLASLGGDVKNKVDLVDSMVKVCRIKL
ncbi:hypothetical protein HER10_EVM0003546 [Colletotrichum scovillei]|uniref:uncharacterized protein n=1 Tax=Colletotrichum scovillei TaxID=1209932 RepID=UPI0015C345F9|nr:uncharacterized protein HER10_EVM0003546 [Colletotrichum scovillei]KAF4772783.1 hypothetical protein HER10_EVM0003546 [Colletotrichum scovillei]